MRTMSSAERQNYIMANASKSGLDRLIERMEGRVDKSVVSDLKRARSFTTRAMVAWIEPVELKSREKLLRESSAVTIGVISDSSKKAEQVAYIKYVRSVREEAYKDGGRDHVLDMAEATMNAICNKCDGRVRAKGCVLYEAYRKYEIEFWDANHPHCEYSGTGEVK